jgi:hypothetical protein
MASPEFHDLAQRFVAFKAAQLDASGEVVDVAVQVIEKVRLGLVKLAGVEGFRSLLLRALALARAQAPELKKLQVAEDGSLHCPAEIEPHQATEEMASGTTGQDGIVLLAHLLELLVTFIGETLTLQLMRDIWPDASINRAIPSTEEKA